MINLFKIRSKGKNNQSGFTLAEIVIAVFFLGFSLTGLLMTFAKSDVLMNGLRENVIASQGLQECMERFRNMDYDAVLLATTCTAESFSLLDSPTPQATITLTPLATLASEPDEDEIRQVRAQIQWTSFNNMTRMMTVSTYITRDGINGQ